MALRQYVGARYVPKFAEPIEWSADVVYGESLIIVEYHGDSYTSRKPVPVGVAPTNAEYWVKTGQYNAQVEQYRQEIDAAVQECKDVTANLEENFDLLNTRVTSVENTLAETVENVNQAVETANAASEAANQVSGKADQALANANTALETANTASQNVEGLRTDVGELETTVAGHSTSIAEQGQRIDSIEGSMRQITVDTATIEDGAASTEPEGSLHFVYEV